MSNKGLGRDSRPRQGRRLNLTRYEVRGVPTLEEALYIAARYQGDHCRRVRVSPGPPFRVVAWGSESV